MLLKDSTTIKFQAKFPKILKACTAFNGTFVFARMDAPGAKESIVHVNKDGKILWEVNYDDIIDFFGMINQKQVIVCNVKESKIDIISLQTRKTLKVNHQFTYDDTCPMDIANFSQTKLFCIIERGGLNDNRLRLAYFPYNNIEENTKPVADYTLKEGQWSYEHRYVKMNNHSKIGMWTYQHDHELVFSYFDLKADPKGKYSTVKAKINIGATYGVGDIQLKITYLWETKPNTYMLVALSNKLDQKDKCKDKDEKDGFINNNYVIDATVGDENATIREAKFHFGRDEDGFYYGDQITNSFGIGNVSVFHTFRHKEGKICTTPIYYVNNDTEEIVYQETWESSCYADNFYFPGWDGSTVVQAIHENGDCEECTINVKKIMDPREISMHFLLHLHQELDDDLLQDAIELMH